MESHAWTPTQKCILDILSDGMLHTRRELHSCLPDELGLLSNIQVHISNIRKRLHPQGEDIVCVLSRGGIFYRHVRVIAPKK